MNIFTHNRIRNTHKHAMMSLVSVCGVLAFLLVLIAPVTNAAPNYQMNYQGKLTNASNVAVADGTYNMRFWLLASSTVATTSALWTETLTGTNRVQVTNGLFSVMLGSTSPLTGVDFNQTLYLGVEIGSTTGSAVWDGEMSPRKVLGTVPAAFEANKLDGIDSTQFVRTDATSTIATSSVNTLLTLTQNGVGDIFNLFDGTTEVFTMTDGGRMGLGTTSPSRLFTMQGGDFWLGGNMTATGTITSATLTVSASSTLSYASSTALTVSGNGFINALTLTGSIAGVLTTNTSGVVSASTTIGDAYISDSLTLTTSTGLPISTGVSGLGTNVATFLATPSSANLAAALTDETGSLGGGLAVFSNAPTFTGTTAFNALTVSATSTLGFASSTAFTSGNTNLGNATSTSLRTLTLGVNGDYITDITGSGLSITNGVLNASGLSNWTDQGTYLTPLTATDGISLSGSSTAQYLTMVNSTSTAATSTNLFASIFTATNGTLANALIGNGTTTNATSTNLRVSGLLTLGSDAITDMTGAGLQNTGNALTCITATGAAFGCLTAADWTTFMGKVASSSIDTSSELAALVTDETGSGSLVFSGSPVFTGGAQFAGIRASASSTLGYASSTALTVSGTSYLNFASSTNASTTGLTAQNAYLSALTFGALPGVLTTSGTGVVSASTTIGDSYLSDALTVSGGTIGSNNIAGTLTTTGTLTIGDNGDIINVDSSTWDVTSGAFTGITNLSVTGSSTIGGGTAVTGLTINGGATTTGNANILGTTLSLNRVQALYVPDQTNFDGTLIVGNGGGSLSHSSGQEGFYNTLTGIGTGLSMTTGSSNALFGGGAGTAITSGNSNSFFGVSAGYRNTGSSNTFIGNAAGQNQLNGSSNVAIGINAGLGVTSNSYSNNTIVGGSAASALTTGSNNLILGSSVGNSGTNLTTGSNNILIGYNIGATSTNMTNGLVIGNLIYGTKLDGSGTTYSTGNIGIGTSSPYAKLTVAGSFGLTGALYDRTASAGTNGMVLQTTGSGVQWVATSTLGLGGSSFSDSAGLAALLSDETGTGFAVFSGSPVFTGGAQFAGIRASASSTLGYASSTALTVSGTSYLANLLATGSSTIGGGTGATGLTINGGATTTGNAYFGGNVGIGSTSPSATLTLLGSGQINPFIVASSTGASLFNVQANGFVGIGSSSPLALLSIMGTTSVSGNASDALRVVGGTGQGAGLGGAISLTGGNGNSGGSGSGGAITLTAGSGGGGGNGYGGVITLAGGDYAGIGGTISITGGQGNNGYNGAPVVINGGPGAARSNVTLATLGGNVGVGSTSPSAKLSIHALNGETNSRLFTIASSTSSATTTFFTVLNTGNVGIGTTTPYANLTIAGTMGLTGAFYDRTASAGTNGMVLQTTGSGVQWVATSTLGLGGSSFSDSAGLAALLSDETGTGFAVFSGSPVFTGGAQFAGIRASASSTLGYASSTALTVSGTSYLANLLATGSSTIGGGTGATGLTISGGATTTGNAYFGGNVGIGSTSPRAKLSINSSTSVIGSELVTNGTFTGNASGWTLQSSCSVYSANSVTVTYDAGCQADADWPALSTDFNTVAGKTYLLTFDIPSSAIDTTYMSLTNGSPGTIADEYATGTHSIYFTTDYTGTETITFDSSYYTINGTWTIDNVSIKEVATITPAFAVTGYDGATWLLLGDNVLGNLGLGSSALSSNTTGYQNIAIGNNTLTSNTTGHRNIAIGNNALTSNTTGYQNIAIGNNTLTSNTTGEFNTAQGDSALYHNTTGNYNTAQGTYALIRNTTGYGNTAQGSYALYGNTTGYFNTVQGNDALIRNTTGYGNTAQGYQALYTNTTGSNNSVLGRYALRDNISSTSTTAVGSYAAYGGASYANQGGVYFGYQSGYSAANGSDYNTMLGYQSGYGVTSGANNILLGAKAGYSGTNLTTGSNNILIGYNIGATSTNMTNGLVIGNLIYGTKLDGSGTTYSTGNIGIGTSSPYAKLTVAGSFGLTGAFYDRTASAGTNGMVLQTTGSGVQWVATSTLGITGGSSFTDSAGLAALLSDETGTGLAVFGTNPLLSGFRSNASSTIGGGTGATGLTINGGATTTGNSYVVGNMSIGTTSASAHLTIDGTGLTGAIVGGMKEYLGFINSTLSAVYYGDETYITNVPTATSTLVGKMIRIADTSALGNVVRGLEVQAHRGTNTKGENTGISGFGRTFGVRGSTMGDAGSTYLPAGIFAESEGTTQGNALRAYSGTMTSENLVYFFHDTSNFIGTGLKMDFGNAGGSFAATSTAKFLDFKVGGVSKFIVAANGSTTIGDGTVNASLRIPYGGICVDNDGSCVSTTTGQIRSVTSALGNSDLAEMYFSNQALKTGEIVSLSGGLSVKRASGDTEKNIIGVVSTKPGMTLGFDDSSLSQGETGYPVGLKGRVPVRLSIENGVIHKGDRISLSSISGVGMKAKDGDRIVGIALEDFDGTKAYSAGFLNQFGDDMVKERVVAQREMSPHSQDGCYNGGGNALGEAECQKKEDTLLELPSVNPEKTRAEMLVELRNTAPESATAENGETYAVGQAIMFIELSWYQNGAERIVLSELATTTPLEGGDTTLWDRIKTLATNFVDGVLSVTGLKADRVEVKDELCVDGVCVTADDLRAILQSTHGGATGGSGEVIGGDTGTGSTGGTETPAEPTPAPTEPPVVEEPAQEAPAEPEVSPELAPEPQPEETPAPEPAPSEPVV